MRKQLMARFKLAKATGVAVMAALSVFGWSATYHVPGDFSDLKDAVAMANTNSDASNVIRVGAGSHPATYQVEVTKDLSIIGDDPSSTIVPTANTGGSGDARGWILVDAGVDIIVKNLTFDGSGFQIGQVIRSYGKGLYFGCTFQNVAYPGYDGRGVVTIDAVGTVNNCTFKNIGRIHSYFYGNTVGSLVIGCRFMGKGDVDSLDYGVELEGGAQVEVDHNVFSDCRGVAYSDGSSSAGILATTYFLGGTGLTAQYNTFTGCTVGVAIGYLTNDTTTATLRYNTFAGNGYYDWPGHSTGVLGVAIDNESSTVPTDAADNFFGSSSGPSGGDGVYGLVTTSPVLVAAVGEQGIPVDLDGTYMMPEKDMASAATTGATQVSESSNGGSALNGTYTPFDSAFGKLPKIQEVMLTDASWSCIVGLSGGQVSGSAYKIGCTAVGDTGTKGALVSIAKSGASLVLSLRSTDGTLTTSPVTETTGASRFLLHMDVDSLGAASATAQTLNGSHPGTTYALGNISTTIDTNAGFIVEADGGGVAGSSTASMTVSGFVTTGGPLNVMYAFCDSPFAKSSGALDYRLGMANVDRPLAGFQAALNNMVPAVQGNLDGRTYTVSPFTSHFLGFGLLLDGGVTYINLYSGLQTWATLSDLTFAAPPVQGVAALGIDASNGSLVTRFSDEFGSAVTATRLDSNTTVVDNTAPVLSSLSATQGATDVLNGAHVTVQGTVHITVDARDLEAGLAGFPTIDIPELGVSGALMSADTGNTFSYDAVVSAASPCGTAHITIGAADDAGNTATTSATLTINKVQVSATIVLDGVSSNVNRWVHIKLGGGGGSNPVIEVDKQVAFTAGSGSVVLDATDGVPDCTHTLTQLWAKDPVHTLGNKVGLSMDANHQYSCTVTLYGGNANEDNVIDILDYGVFAFQWGSHPSANSAIGEPNGNADFSCNGTVGTEDFSYISTGFLSSDAADPGGYNQPKNGPKEKCTVKEMTATGVPEGVAQAMDIDKDGWITVNEVSRWLDIKRKATSARG